MDNLSDKIALKALMNIEFLLGRDLILNRRVLLKYSGHFTNYNANVRYTKNYVEFNLSTLWKNVDEDIQIGLIESLVIRMFKLKNVSTSNMKLYESFMKGLSKYARSNDYDPELEESFDRVNEKFFNGMMEKPNLMFANESFRKLGSYEYSTNTIYMSTIFQGLPENEKQFLDYVMYHELLHKKHTFNVKNGRHQAHTTIFRKDEKKFGAEDNIDMEKELNTWLRKKKYSIKRIFGRW
ncbi:MAG: SprT-like domain-containing protein [Candidatus Woesearchaeota archaeon]